MVALEVLVPRYKLTGSKIHPAIEPNLSLGEHCEVGCDITDQYGESSLIGTKCGGRSAELSELDGLERGEVQARLRGGFSQRSGDLLLGGGYDDRNWLGLRSAHRRG